ncbi:hypothetical protein ACFQ0O_21675 [Saccharopolyspora spinosporotrichia]
MLRVSANPQHPSAPCCPAPAGGQPGLDLADGVEVVAEEPRRRVLLTALQEVEQFEVLPAWRTRRCRSVWCRYSTSRRTRLTRRTESSR